MCPFIIHAKDIPHQKCVLCCCFNFTPDRIPHKDVQDNIYMPNI